VIAPAPPPAAVTPSRFQWPQRDWRGSPTGGSVGSGGSFHQGIGWKAVKGATNDKACWRPKVAPPG